ncbi:hypothetical protein P3T76_015318 [Phytophthora citrophthora]|uniref:Uncharacterized protein n=1 Tax=Phytophthora citrophthora TaxID=4793 RepID=A0AAD9FZQ1_9STRA|nr:hypothetical protein P3T76_015318 [Phytophthora citrophthora]
MASTSSSSVGGTVHATSVYLGSLNDSETTPVPTETVNNTNSSDQTTISAPLLVGIIAASVIVFVAVLFLIRSGRRRHEPKLLSPSTSAFQGVTSTTASENTNVLESSAVSTVVNSPLMQTFKLSRLSAKEPSGEHSVIDIHDVPVRDTQASRRTSLISGKSVFSASILMLRSSLPTILASRSSRASRTNEPQELNTPASTSSFAQTDQNTQVDAWRELSETCWSIGPGSDSETESGRFMMPFAPLSQAKDGVLVLARRLSTLSDEVADIEEGVEKDINSLDDSSRRRDLVMSSLDNLSPRKERGISQFDDSSPRRVRGLSALDSRRKAELDTNKSGTSYFSVDSDYMYYDETIKDCSSVLFDSDSDSLSSSDSDDSLREEEF